MEKTIYLNELFDIYGELLTEKQQEYFKDYYFLDLSYGEISEKYNVSRNAIFHQLKNITEKLMFFEAKLQIYSKNQKINDIIKLMDDENICNELKKLI